MLTFRFWMLVVPVWFALSVICGMAWGATGWAIRRYRRWQGEREYRRWSESVDQQVERHRQTLDSIARYSARHR